MREPLILQQATSEDRLRISRIRPPDGMGAFVHYSWFWLDRTLLDPAIQFRLVRLGERRKLVGVVVFGPHEPIDLDRSSRVAGIGEVYHLVIDRRSARQKLGRRTTLAALRQLALTTPDLSAVRIAHHPDNIAAAQLYRSLGFAPAGEKIDSETGTRDVLMEASRETIMDLLGAGTEDGESCGLGRLVGKTGEGFMANEFRNNPSHSAEYFGETRDHWWNIDYLELIGRRLALERARDVLDVGCGVGHWGQLLASVLPSGARVQGVDRDPFWVERATERATARGLADRFSYRVGVAEQLPFADASFDLVTCQTVLIHSPDPGVAVDEMIRVARPGGLVLAHEPNNVASALLLDTLSFHGSVEDITARVRFQLMCERGKAALGEGHNSIGDLVPGLFARRGLSDIRAYLNDKTAALLPPYGSPDQRATLEERDDFEARDFWIWSRHDTRRYFLAGGGSDGELDHLWAIAMSGSGELRKAVAEGTYASAGGVVCYIVAGRKPAA